MKNKSILNARNITILMFVLCIYFNTNAQEFTISSIKIFPTNGLKIEFNEIIQKDSTLFKPYNTTTIPRDSNATFWIKFNYSQLKHSSNLVLFNHHLWFRKIQLYYFENGKIIYQQTGNMVPINQKTIKDPASAMVHLPNTLDNTVCYLYVESNFGFWFPFIVNDLDIKQSENFINNNLEFIFYGILVLSIIFSMSFLVYLREKIYLYYLTYCLLLGLSRTLYNGFLYDFLPIDYLFINFKYLIRIYSFISMGITVTLFLYIKEFLSLKNQVPLLSRLISILISIRIVALLLYIILWNTNVGSYFTSHYIDIGYLAILFLVCIYSYKTNLKTGIIASLGIGTILIGIIVHTFEIQLFHLSSPFIAYINLSSLEVIIFSIGVAYRHNHLKKENEKASKLLINQLKENEKLKDIVNQELEIKVHERTLELQSKNEEIAKMNDLLKSHNITLKNEIVDVKKARIFQKNMNFEEFKGILSDDNACLKYLSELKWNDQRKYKCQKCGYDNYKVLENYSRKCRKCNHSESPMVNTLFQNVKFSLLKAFYITYLSSTGTKETIEEMSKALELRGATFWKFRQKVLTIIEKNNSRKKHKDGWTHLIEYSIEEKNA